MEMSDAIYANAEIIRNVKSATLDQNPPNSPGEEHSGRRIYRLTAVCLGLLTVLLLLIIAVLCIHYNGVLNNTMVKYSTLSEILNQLQTNYSSLTAERDQLQTNCSSLTRERDQLQTKYRTLTAERNQLQTNYSSLTAERNQLQTNYNSLRAERNQLKHTCPQGWIKFSSSYYYVSSERRTWSESQQNCIERGADLVIINNIEEQIFLSAFHHIWIGLTDREIEGNWKWVDSTTPTTRYWRSGEPNDSGNSEDCAVIHGENPRANWNDVPCNSKSHWLCEKPAP